MEIRSTADRFATRARRAVVLSGVSAFVVMLLQVSPAAACLKSNAGRFGIVWTGESWAFYGSPPPALRPLDPEAKTPKASIVFYDDSGVVLGTEAVFDPSLAAGHFVPRAVTPEGHLWGVVSCVDESPEARCGKAIRVAASGDVLEVAEAGPAPWREVDLRVEWLTDGGRSHLDVEWTGSGRTSRLSSPFRSDAAPMWAKGRRGDLAVVWFGSDRVVLVRYGPSGDEELRRSFPRSLRPGLEDGPEGPVKIGRGRMVLADDGSVIVGGWSLDSDCTPAHAASFIVLGPDGDQRSWVRGTAALGMVVSPSGTLGVHRAAGVELFDLDGRRLGSLRRPAEWQERQSKLFREAAALGPESEPADWIRDYKYFPRQRSWLVDDWIVSAWPANAGQLAVDLLLELSPRICESEKQIAGRELLAAFRSGRSSGLRVSFLRAAAACLDRPPTDVVDWVRSVADRGSSMDSKPAREALSVWGLLETDEESLDPRRAAREAAWSALLSSPVGDPLPGSREFEIGRQLLLVELPRIVPDVLSAVQRGGDEAERALDFIRETLFRVPRKSSPRNEDHRRALKALASGLKSVDPSAGRSAAASRVGDLLALALDGDAGALDSLLASRGFLESDQGAFWLGFAIAAAKEHGLLSQEVLEETAARYVALGAYGGPDWCWRDEDFLRCRGRPAGDPLATMLRLVGREGFPGVWLRGLDASASVGARTALLTFVSSDPGVLSEERWVRLLRQPWLLEVELLHSTIEVLRVAPSEGPVWAEVSRVWRQLLDDHGVKRVLRVGGFSRPRRGAGWSELTSLLEPEDLMEAVSTLRDLRIWVRLVARVGAWQGIARELEVLAEGNSLYATAGLAGLGDRPAFERLLAQGLSELPDVESGLQFFRAEAVQRLTPHANHLDSDHRTAVRRCLRKLGMPADLASDLADEARRRLEAGELPELQSLLILAEQDMEAAALAVQGLVDSSRLSSLGSRLHRPASSRDLARLLGRIARSDATASRAALAALEDYASMSPEAARQLSLSR